MVDLFAVFWGNSIWFSIVDVPTYIPTNSAQGCPFLHLLTNAVISCPLDDSHSSKCGVISHCMVFICISLTISGGEHHLMFPLAICPSPWEKCEFFSKAAPYPVKGSYLHKDQSPTFSQWQQLTLGATHHFRQIIWTHSHLCSRQVREAKYKKRRQLGHLASSQWNQDPTQAAWLWGTQFQSPTLSASALMGKLLTGGRNCARNPLQVPTATKKAFHLEKRVTVGNPRLFV